jgi:hypothetical protein
MSHYCDKLLDIRTHWKLLSAHIQPLRLEVEVIEAGIAGAAVRY